MKFPKPKNAKDWQQVYNAIKNASEKDFPDADPVKFGELKRNIQTMWVGPVLLLIGAVPMVIFVLLGSGGIVPMLWFFAWGIPASIISVTRRKRIQQLCQDIGLFEEQ